MISTTPRNSCRLLFSLQNRPKIAHFAVVDPADVSPTLAAVAETVRCHSAARKRTAITTIITSEATAAAALAALGCIKLGDPPNCTLSRPNLVVGKKTNAWNVAIQEGEQIKQ